MVRSRVELFEEIRVDHRREGLSSRSQEREPLGANVRAITGAAERTTPDAGEHGKGA